MEEQQIPVVDNNYASNLTDEGSKKKRRRPFRKFFTALLVLGLLTIVIWILLGSVFSYSKGFREGYVYKFSNKGVIFKTWEGTLKTGFISFNNTSTPNEEWLFSVKDSEVVDMLNKMGERTLLKLHYTQYFTKLFWRGKTTYFITKVEVIKQ
jgi:hypothetical protein